jgi:isopenicillin-N N-acyltransferase-like protein
LHPPSKDYTIYTSTKRILIGKVKDMDRHIPIIVSTGEPFVRGLQLGRSEKERVIHTITAYMEMFLLKAGLQRHEALANAERFIPVIENYAPHLLEEMRGIAEGAGRDLREIIAINARTELVYGARQQAECTSIGITAAASSDGHLRLAQNWDWHPSQVGVVILWIIRRTDGPDVMTLTEAGMVGKIGLNGAGLAMCINLLSSDSDYAGPAVPMHIILRSILEKAHTVEEVITILNTTKRCTSCNHLLADRSGSLADVEATPNGQRVLYPVNGILTHTNHCINPELFERDRFAREQPETLAREDRVSSLASKQKIDEAYLHTILSDHGTSPHSICLHQETELPEMEQSESIASIIFDLTVGSVDIADGPPCQHAYNRLLIADYLRPFQEAIHASSAARTGQTRE